MKIILIDLWKCKSNVIIVWIFFFCLSLIEETPHGIFALFLISGLFSIILVVLGILFVKSKYYF